MKEIKAIIQPGKLHTVREALTSLPDFPGMSVSRAEGCGPSVEKNGRPLNTREELIEFSPKVRIEIVVADEQADEIVRLIKEKARTGRVGDGIIWITEVEYFCRIRL